MDLKLKGKKALVTGSTAGIGFATAEALANEGAEVIINGRTQAAVDKAVTDLRSKTGGDVTGFAGDLSQAVSAGDLVAHHPRIDVLINNLATFEVKPFEEITDQDWAHMFDVNVVSGVRLARLLLPNMEKAKLGTRGFYL